jgi:serine/threonine-protein kinase
MQVAGFTVEELLASGSFGIVYRARRDGRPFAIKLIPMDERGHREVDALRRVRHPNVVGFHGYGLWPEDEPRFLVLALELVEGRSLDVWVREENPSALELVEQVLLPFVETLGEVHAAGVVHRDIKEANIIMREADGQPVLVDFGAAGYEGAPRLTAVLPPGTPEYRSPEAVRFARESSLPGPYPAGPGDDLWALGVTTYFLLTRMLPFGDRESLGMNRAILEETPLAPHKRNPRVPPALGELCLRMLEKAPESRYADAEALRAALEEMVSTRADDTWRMPLFPGGGQKQHLALARLPAEREHPPQRGSWTVGLVLAAAFLLSAYAEDSPHTASSLHHVTPRASSSQELAAADMWGEVASGAGPQKSSTSAPMHREVHAMFKPRKARSLVATAALTGATCVGSACVSGPQQRPPPPPADCPPGSDEAHRRFDIHYGWHGALFAPFEGPVLIIPVKEGPVTARSIGPWGRLPDLTFFSGQLYIGTERVYGRFTEARLPSGEVVPVCLEMYLNTELGVPLENGSTPERPLMLSSVSVVPVKRFK